MDAIWKFIGIAATPDESGDGFEPSRFARMLAVDSKTDYRPIDFEKKYSGDKRILVICTEQRYMTMENGTKFSTGNHPVETCLPLMHLKNAGFDFDVVTPNGNPACIEMWALPQKDEVFMEFFNNDFKLKADKPLSLADTVANRSKLDSYASLYIPGGHGAMLGLPEDSNVEKAIMYMVEEDKYAIAVCHGPAPLMAVKSDPHPFKGYKIACFPDSVDKQTPMIGYLPGKMTWFVGEKLLEKGLTIVNTAADDTTCVDRKLLSGASPKACQEMGKIAAEKLLEVYA